MARSKRKPMSDINVVPYIDVMLVLLIIFMVTAPMLTQGIKVELPLLESDPVTNSAQEEPVIVTIDVNGAFYMEMSESKSRPLEIQEIIKRVSAVRAQSPSVSVLIRGDRHVEYGAVVNLMSALQASGVVGVGLITEDP